MKLKGITKYALRYLEVIISKKENMVLWELEYFSVCEVINIPWCKAAFLIKKKWVKSQKHMEETQRYITK